MEIIRFSNSTLAALEPKVGHGYYVYCLVDPRTAHPFYIGKGKGNRVFAHKQAALGAMNARELEGETLQTLKIQTIQDILAEGQTIASYLISYGLTEEQAFASENTLINYTKIIQKLELTNLVSGHGTRAFLTEEVEERFGYQPIELADIPTEELILAVKVKDAFQLSKDESKEYPIQEEYRDVYNLKSRTLGSWVIGKEKIDKIRYVIAVNTGADNAVVAAYKVSKEHAESRKAKNGRTRYAFKALSSREDTLKELNLYKRALPSLTFGSGSATCYINGERMKNQVLS